jgi:hypothetical protein
MWVVGRYSSVTTSLPTNLHNNKEMKTNMTFMLILFVSHGYQDMMDVLVLNLIKVKVWVSRYPFFIPRIFHGSLTAFPWIRVH